MKADIAIYYLSSRGFWRKNMSINSINHDEISDIASKWDGLEDEPKKQSESLVKSAEARRRIEAMKEIRDSGLSLEEARELGLIH